MRKLIYICGMGHNGSTVLDLILDRADNLRSLGQLNNLLVPDDPRKDPEILRSQFWRNVLDTISAEDTVRMVTANSGVLKERSLLRHVFSNRARRQYANINQGVVDGIFANISETTIIDSSKNVARCLGLLELENCEMYVIHLIRDVRGFVNSHNMRRREQGANLEYLRPTLYWFAKNLAASIFVRPRAINYVIVKYESLLSNPGAVIDQLEAFLHEDLAESRLAIEGRIALDSSETLGFSGNRILHARKSFYFDRNKSKQDGAYLSRSYWLICGWVSKLWGYRFIIRK